MSIFKKKPGFATFPVQIKYADNLKIQFVSYTQTESFLGLIAL